MGFISLLLNAGLKKLGDRSPSDALAPRKAAEQDHDAEVVG